MFDRIAEANVASIIEERPAYQLMKLIDDMLVAAEPALARRKAFFKDGGEGARTALANLKAAASQAEKLILPEEQSRPQYTIPKSVYREQTRLRTAAVEAAAALHQCEVDLEKARTALITRQSQLSEDIEMQQLQKMNVTGEEIAETNLKLNELMVENETLNRQRDELERKVNGGCCGCVMTKSKRLAIDSLAEVNGHLKQVNASMKAIKNASAGQAAVDPVTELKQELEAVRKALKKHDETHAATLSPLKERVDAAQLSLATKEVAMKAAEAEYYGQLSEPVMEAVVSLYAHFNRFQTAANEFLLKTGSVSTKLQEFLKQVKNVHDRFEEKIEVLTCPALGNQTAKMIIHVNAYADVAMAAKPTRLSLT